MDTMDVATIVVAWLLTEYLTICAVTRYDEGEKIKVYLEVAGAAAIMVVVIFAIYLRYNQ